jgi:hypothetical protein
MLASLIAEIDFGLIRDNRSATFGVARLAMEQSPYVLRTITHFSIREVEKFHPRLNEIETITLEI